MTLTRLFLNRKNVKKEERPSKAKRYIVDIKKEKTRNFYNITVIQKYEELWNTYLNIKWDIRHRNNGICKVQ